ncbi:MAG: energy transducer TonB [Bdellovibrionales bacterium]|nr:energy transducer TonB [Bdellovibrionales bacterium]
MYVYHSEESQRPLESYLVYGLLVSLVVHVLVVVVFLTRSPISPPQVEVFEVSLAPLEAIQQKARHVVQPISQPNQIVTEPQSKESEVPAPQTRFEAEKNRVVEKEQLKRGVDPEAGKSVSQTVGGDAPQAGGNPRKAEQAAERKPQPQQKSENAPQKLTQLRLDSSTLLETVNKVQEEEQKSRKSGSGIQSLAGYQAFSRPRGSGARFLGEAGSADYLPNLPDGDITLLNTKANRFAVFVRRVATQVFSELRQTGWQNLSAGDIRKIEEFSTVRAVLSPEGQLLGVELITPSGSVRFDEVLSKAVRQGARDPHPPREAAAGDGNIRFIFKARTWSRFGPSGAGGAISERRWLLLGTGLE